MTPVTTPPPPLPGSMTVSPLFGWEHVLTALVLVVLVAVVALVALAVGRGSRQRAEFRAGLEARSARRRDG